MRVRELAIHPAIQPSHHPIIQPLLSKEVRHPNQLINQLTNRLNFHSTHDIIRAIDADNFPKQVMLNFHPKRWHSKPLPWLKQFIWQNAKNQAKRVLIAVRKK
jgi:hypothetical protein